MIVVTRTLSQVDLGIYYAAAAYPQLLSRVFDFGLPHAARYFLLRYPNHIAYLCKISVVISALSFPIIAGLFVSIQFLPLELGEIGQTISAHWFLLTTYCVVLVLNSIFNGLVISIEKYTILLFALSAPYAIFILVILYKANYGVLDVDDVLLQLLVSELLVMSLYAIPIVRYFKYERQIQERPFHWRNVILYALKIFPNGLLKTLTTRLDRVILSFFATPTFIGQYSVLVTIRDIGILPITTYGQVFMNDLTRAIKEKTANITRMVDRRLLSILGIYSIGFLFFLLIQDFVLNLFFDEGVDAQLRLMSGVLCLTVIPNALVGFITYVYLVLNKAEHVSIASAISLFVFYTIVFVGNSFIGMDIFFYASVFSALVGFGYLFLFYRKMKNSFGKLK